MKEKDPTINVRIPPALLHQMDVCVGSGLYICRSDFIRAAMRKLLDSCESSGE